MIIFDPALAQQLLVQPIRQARTELRVQAETLPPTLLNALREARQRGVTIRYLLGPKAAYTLDAKGEPLLARRPYDNGPQAADLEFAASTGELLINPRFSELGTDRFQPGTRSHAFYLTDGRQAVLCTAAPSAPARPTCLAGDVVLARALAALFDSEFDERLTAQQRAALLAEARRTLVVGPDDNGPLLELLATSGATVMTSALDRGKALTQLLRGGGKTLVVPPGLARTPAVEAARAAGVRVVARSMPFEGTAVWAPTGAFLGSQRLTDAALGRDRDVGVMLERDGAAAVRQLLEGLP